jgi:hypothetical protein
MARNRKTLSGILLIIVYALLVFQEVAVNQVLCYKENGRADLELAIFDLACECREAHAFHHNSNDGPTCGDDSCLSSTCFDLPLNNSWLERNILAEPPEIKLCKLGDPPIALDLLFLNAPFKRLPEPVPLHGLFYIPPFPNDSVFLRC